VLVADAYNPSYTRGRVQEDGNLKAALGKYFGDHISKKKITKKLVEWLKW
jgi:hypothetical protein